MSEETKLIKRKSDKSTTETAATNEEHEEKTPVEKAVKASQDAKSP